jgi:hypothetical protein
LNNPTFFDPTTGEPIVWHFKNDRGEIELFDLMGFHPQTGEELIPITREVVAAWKTQTAKVVRRVPVRVDDPERLGFFEPTTGAAKVCENGDYEFFDGPGFHPRSGDQFQIVTRDVIAEWRRQQEAVAAKKRPSRSNGKRKLGNASNATLSRHENSNRSVERTSCRGGTSTSGRGVLMTLFSGTDDVLQFAVLHLLAGQASDYQGMFGRDLRTRRGSTLRVFGGLFSLLHPFTFLFLLQFAQGSPWRRGIPSTVEANWSRNRCRSTRASRGSARAGHRPSLRKP